ncbi:hypothetical protein BDQ17DRAFT_1431199 [Cyathus striatus]|nr:hypothetical protein BDQ17DRAFT_1431199 [Cyathus striatus]
MVNIPHKFVNLEGAGAGGNRPLVFCSTSLSPMRNYNSPQPHESIITAGAFLCGVVPLLTDFTVNMNGHQGMEVLDITFHESRVWYHMMHEHDSLHGAGGAREFVGNDENG